MELLAAISFWNIYHILPWRKNNIIEVSYTNKLREM